MNAIISDMKNTTDSEFRMKIFKTSDESQRRWFAAEKAAESGYGGIRRISDITGLPRTTITLGIKEPKNENPSDSEMIGKTGGGRKKSEDKDENVIRRINEIPNGTTVGDPMSLPEWCRKSARNIADGPNAEGSDISYGTVCRISEDSDCSLQGNRKVISQSNDINRDGQFRYIDFFSENIYKGTMPCNFG